jgi:hypothetical protein
VLDPDSGWNQTDTTLWFALAEGVGASSVAQYELRVAAPMQDLSDPSEVFHFADFFDRPDSVDVGPSWVTLETDPADAAISGNALWFGTNNEKNLPIVSAAFARQTGRLAAHVGFRWSRATENTYRVHIQVGDSAAMVTPVLGSDDVDAQGVGPHVAWAGLSFLGASAHETLLAETDTGFVELGQVQTARLVLDGSPPAGVFRVLIDGVQQGPLYNFARSITGLDTLRLVAWELGSPLPVRAFDWVFVRDVAGEEPTVAYSDTCPVP